MRYWIAVILIVYYSVDWDPEFTPILYEYGQEELSEPKANFDSPYIRVYYSEYMLDYSNYEDIALDKILKPYIIR